MNIRIEGSAYCKNYGASLNVFKHYMWQLNVIQQGQKDNLHFIPCILAWLYSEITRPSLELRRFSSAFEKQKNVLCVELGRSL